MVLTAKDALIQAANPGDSGKEKDNSLPTAQSTLINAARKNFKDIAEQADNPDIIDKAREKADQAKKAQEEARVEVPDGLAAFSPENVKPNFENVGIDTDGMFGRQPKPESEKEFQIFGGGIPGNDSDGKSLNEHLTDAENGINETINKTVRDIENQTNKIVPDTGPLFPNIENTVIKAVAGLTVIITLFLLARAAVTSAVTEKVS